PGPRGGGPPPGGAAGEQRDHDGGPARQQQSPAEPAAAADRQGEQGLELLIGLLVTGGSDLRAAEQADREDEEDEDEGQIAGRRGDRSGAELRDLPLQALRDPSAGHAV